MYEPLALKYRPQTLADLTGQDYIQRTLTAAIAHNRIAPAYLFTGSRGTGKTSTARILAKSLNCHQTIAPTPAPCGSCSSCKAIENGNSMDVTEIDAASHNGVDDARQLIEQSSYTSIAGGRYKVFILDESHSLSNAAQNALLKSIEEPRSGVVFVLCTTEAHKVLPTVSSRCQVFNFRTISSLAIASRLNFIAQTESIPLKEAGAIAIARISQGGLRDAIQLLDQLSLLGEEITPDLVLNISGSVPEAELVNIIRCLSTGNVLGLLTLSRELTELGKEPKTILSSLLSLMRDLLVTKHTPNGDFSLLNVSEETARQLTMFAAAWSVESIEAGIEKLSSAENRLRYSLQPQVWMEVTLLELLGATQTMPLSPTNNDSTSKLPPPSIDTVWSQVLSKATGSYANLLSNGELIEIDSSKVIVKVKSELLEKFRANSTLIQRLFRKELNNEQLNVEFVAS